MQTVADMRGVGVKNRGKFADVLCGRPLMESESVLFSSWLQAMGLIMERVLL